jgi:hypothetical protein
VTIDGHSGSFVELTATDPIDGCVRGGDGGLWTLPTGEAIGTPDPFGRTELWILEVDGTRLVIDANVRSAASLEMQDQLHTMVETLRIDPIP